MSQLYSSIRIGPSSRRSPFSPIHQNYPYQIVTKTCAFEKPTTTITNEAKLASNFASLKTDLNFVLHHHASSGCNLRAIALENQALELKCNAKLEEIEALKAKCAFLESRASALRADHQKNKIEARVEFEKHVHFQNNHVLNPLRFEIANLEAKLKEAEKGFEDEEVEKEAELRSALDEYNFNSPDVNFGLQEKLERQVKAFKNEMQDAEFSLENEVEDLEHAILEIQKLICKEEEFCENRSRDFEDEIEQFKQKVDVNFEAKKAQFARNSKFEKNKRVQILEDQIVAKTEEIEKLFSARQFQENSDNENATKIEQQLCDEFERKHKIAQEIFETQRLKLVNSIDALREENASFARAEQKLAGENHAFFKIGAETEARNLMARKNEKLEFQVAEFATKNKALHDFHQEQIKIYYDSKMQFLRALKTESEKKRKQISRIDAAKKHEETANSTFENKVRIREEEFSDFIVSDSNIKTLGGFFRTDRDLIPDIMSDSDASGNLLVKELILDSMDDSDQMSFNSVV